MRYLAWVCVGVCVVVGVACGGDDDSGLDGSGASGGTSGSGASGGSSGNGGSGGGAAGSSSGGQGGNAGSPSGGTAGVASGGTAGGSSGGTAGGSSGGSGGGTTDGGSGDCPGSAPTQDAECTSPGTVCCYGSDPAKPWRCVPSSTDGGGPFHWVTLQSKVCCPSAPPQVGSQCNAPGDLTCCYSGTGFLCNGQPNPDEWMAVSCD